MEACTQMRFTKKLFSIFKKIKLHSSQMKFLRLLELGDEIRRLEFRWGVGPNYVENKRLDTFILLPINLHLHVALTGTSLSKMGVSRHSKILIIWLSEEKTLRKIYILIIIYGMRFYLIVSLVHISYRKVKIRTCIYISWNICFTISQNLRARTTWLPAFAIRKLPSALHSLG